MTIIDWRRYHTGYCRHPECTVVRGGAMAMRKFPAWAFALFHAQRGWILFDTGYSQHFLDATSSLPEYAYRMVTPVVHTQAQALRTHLMRDGIADDQLAGIFLSHLHADHISGVLDFPRVPIWCSEAAVQDMRGRNRLSALRVGILPGLLGHDFDQRHIHIEQLPRVALPAVLAEFGSGHDLLGDGSLIAVALPGHAQGQYGLVFQDPHGLVFLVADAAWSLQLLRAGELPPRWTLQWLGDATEYVETFKKLHRLVQQPELIRLVPSHLME